MSKNSNMISLVPIDGSGMSGYVEVTVVGEDATHWYVTEWHAPHKPLTVSKLEFVPYGSTMLPAYLGHWEE